MRNKLVKVALLGILGISIMLIRADRVLVRAEPGDYPLVPLMSDTTYNQRIDIVGGRLGKISLFFRKRRDSEIAKHVAIAIQDERGSIRRTTIPLTVIADHGATRIPLHKPFLMQHSGIMELSISVPKELSGILELQTSSIDKNNSKNKHPLMIDGNAQEISLAYEIFENSHPPLALQIGGLFMVSAIYFMMSTSVAANFFPLVFAGVASLLYIFPSRGVNSGSLLIIIIQSVVFLFVYYASHHFFHRSYHAALAGAIIIAFTTWWPLHIAHVRSLPDFSDQLSFIDVFLDPNQTFSSHAYGSYIGTIPAMLAFVGLLSRTFSTRVNRHRLVDVGFFLLAAIGSSSLFLTSLLLRHLFILTTIAIAYFAEYGIDTMHRFLGKDDMLARCILYALIGISLVDLLHVGELALRL